MNKLTIQIPYSFQDPDRFQYGWNEAIKTIRELNPSLDYEEICLMDYEKCGCEDCEKENSIMDR